MCMSSKCHTCFNFSVVDLVFQQLQRSTLLWLEAITSRPCGTETTAVTVNSDCSSPLLVKAETRPSFPGLEGWIVDEMNGPHILMLWEKVYGAREDKRERASEETTSSNTSSVLRLFALWHQFAPVYSSFIFMRLLARTFSVRVWRHVWHVYVCFDCMQQQ